MGSAAPFILPTIGCQAKAHVRAVRPSRQGGADRAVGCELDPADQRADYPYTDNRNKGSDNRNKGSDNRNKAKHARAADLRRWTACSQRPRPAVRARPSSTSRALGTD